MRRLLAAVFLAAALSCAHAQNSFVTPGNSTAGGAVQMCLNQSNLAVPCNGTPVTASFSGADTSSQAISLPGAARVTTYICGFSVSGLGATAATNVLVTVAPLVGGNTASYQYSYALGATVANTPLNVNFSPCVPANAVNTAITVTVPGAAGNTSTTITATGFQM